MLGKLMKAMQAMSNPRKDKIADVKTKSGYTYTYNYSDLAQVLSIVKPALAENGLCLLQCVQYVDSVPYLVTYVFDETKKMELSRRMLHDYTDAQAQGSGLTYTRRYELITVFGLAAEDDDGKQTKTARTLPNTLKGAQQMLLKAEREYCARNLIQDVSQFHQDIMCREDYRNDVSALTKIAMELMDVG